MEENKRCSTCSTYPFCNKCESPISCCENWRKRKVGGEESGRTKKEDARIE